MLHTVITGPPGVGKTELGRILGRIYKAMGVLSKGHMHIAKRSDLIGKYLTVTSGIAELPEAGLVNGQRSLIDLFTTGHG